MATRLYDDALLKKLQNWTANTSLKIYGVQETRRLFEVIADETDDRPISLPILCVRRSRGFNITNINRQPLSYSAATIRRTQDKAMNLNAIPMELQYQLDIYTRYYEEADEFARNIVFNIVNFPSLTVKLPYLDQEIQHKSTIRMQNEVQDNSDIPERFVDGNFTRLTINLTIPDAYIWDVRVRDTSSVAGSSIQVTDQDASKIDKFDPDEDDNQKPEEGYIPQQDGKGIIIHEESI